MPRILRFAPNRWTNWSMPSRSRPSPYPLVRLGSSTTLTQLGYPGGDLGVEICPEPFVLIELEDCESGKVERTDGRERACELTVGMVNREAE